MLEVLLDNAGTSWSKVSVNEKTNVKYLNIQISLTEEISEIVGRYVSLKIGLIIKWCAGRLGCMFGDHSLVT